MLELHFSTGGPGLRFVSTSAEQITVAVNHVMSRWKLSQPVFITDFYLNSVPGKPKKSLRVLRDLKYKVEG